MAGRVYLSGAACIMALMLNEMGEKKYVKIGCFRFVYTTISHNHYPMTMGVVRSPLFFGSSIATHTYTQHKGVQAKRRAKRNRFFVDRRRRRRQWAFSRFWIIASVVCRAPRGHKLSSVLRRKVIDDDDDKNNDTPAPVTNHIF